VISPLSSRIPSAPLPFPWWFAKGLMLTALHALYLPWQKQSNTGPSPVIFPGARRGRGGPVTPATSILGETPREPQLWNPRAGSKARKHYTEK